MRIRSKPHGLDGLRPRDTQIVRGANQHAEFTAKFAQQALLCTVHKVVTTSAVTQQQDHLTLDDDRTSNPRRPG